MSDDPLARIRAMCLTLPETTERLSHGAPTWFVRDKKTFVTYMDDHHGDGRLAIWCGAPLGIQAMLVEEDPQRFFVPPYVGHRGWLGVRLDVDVDWGEVAGIVEDAYRVVAPKRLVTELEEGRGRGRVGEDEALSRAGLGPADAVRGAKPRAGVG